MDSQHVTVSVPKDRVVHTTDRDDADFFKVLLSTQSYLQLNAQVEKTFKNKTKFQDMLATYLTVISNRLEEVAPHLSDDEFVGLTNWVLLQGRDVVQAFLSEPFENNPRWRTGAGALQSAPAHWFMATGS
jgi:hypothetical protein